MSSSFTSSVSLISVPRPAILVAIITGVVFVILGAIIFRRLQRGFAEEF